MIPPSTLSAFGPGKVILLGEHGVVYGYPALAAPLSIGVTATALLRAGSEEASVEVPAELRGPGRRLLVEAFDAAVRVSGAGGLRMTLDSELPPSMGLGSSAAVAVACAGALLKSRGRSAPPTVEEIARVAWEMEKVFHGTPSGIDHTTSARNQLIHFRRAADGDPSKAQVTPVTVKRPFGLVVALVGERPSTKETVAALRARQARWPERYARVFEQIGTLVEEGRGAIERGELELLGDVMDMNQGLLNALGLSSAGIEEMVHRLRAAGALGAKLTGAGGDGGAVIGLFEEADRVVTRLRRAGIKCFASRIGEAAR
ncbi:MAG: mevalonate kinase [Myxococcaceae bacterium]|nr:mevalonate kinase [Myxococcaceae bacterium]